MSSKRWVLLATLLSRAASAAIATTAYTALPRAAADHFDTRRSRVPIDH